MSFSAKTEAAYRMIKRDILNGTYLPDEPLRLPALAARYGLSATPLREALSRLTEHGFAQAAANRGWRVAGVSVAQVEDLEHARLAVETQMLADSIDGGSLDWESAIVGAHHRLVQVTPPLGPCGMDDRQRWIAAHEAFHTALVSGRPPGWLDRCRSQITEQLQRHHQAILFNPASFAGQGTERQRTTDAHLREALSLPRHRHLMDAVLARDLNAALDALRDHVATTLAVYRSLQETKTEAQAAPIT